MIVKPNPPPSIPQKARPILAWLSWALLLAGPGLAALILLMPEGRPKQAVTIVLGILLSIAASLKGGLSNPVAKTSGAVLLLAGVLCIAAAGCKSPYATAWGSTATLKQMTQAAGKGLAAASKAELAVGKDAAPICKRLAYWRSNIRPAARTAVAASWAAIRTARDAKQSKLDYLSLLKPGACAILLGLREWGHKLPDRGKGILKMLEPFAKMVCPQPGASARAAKAGNALAIVGAVLPGALEFVRWLVQLIGKGNDKLEQEIGAWIVASPRDETDALISAKCPQVWW